eukprot:COSAG01_NODE_60648_length_293_cov_1.329897_1_plen_44_part_10
MLNADFKGMAGACIVAARQAKKADWFAILEKRQDANSIKAAMMH